MGWARAPIDENIKTKKPGNRKKKIGAEPLGWLRMF